jgi:DNA-binding transcriptional LysR family regulator
MDIPRVDAWSLHCVAVLVRESNVTRAGALLGLSQPATSAVLAKLRLLFQDPLLVKSGSGMVPTPRALQLAGRAEKVLEDLRAMVAPEQEPVPAKLEGTVAIAAMDLVRMLLMPRLVEVLQREAPGLAISVHDVDRTRIHERFEHAEIDLGIGPQLVTLGRLHYRELWRDTPVCLLREGHPALDAPLTLERFAELTHVRVVPSRLSYYDDALEKALLALGLKRRVQVSERSFLMVPRMLESTDLVAVVPRRFAEDACERHPLRAIAAPLALPGLSMGMYWHERTHRDPKVQWLRQRIAVVISTMAGLNTE